MAERTAEIDVDGTPDAVWALVGDFGGIAGWMPGMESCRVEGDHRILDTMGMTITEKLISRDDATRAITYGIVDGVPVESHEATITVTAAGDGGLVWGMTGEVSLPKVSCRSKEVLSRGGRKETTGMARTRAMPAVRVSP